MRLVTVAALCTNKRTENVYISCSFSTRPTGTPLHVELSSMNWNNTLSRPVRLRQFLYCLFLCGYHHFSRKFLVATPAKTNCSGNAAFQKTCCLEERAKTTDALKKIPAFGLKFLCRENKAKEWCFRAEPSESCCSIQAECSLAQSPFKAATLFLHLVEAGACTSFAGPPTDRVVGGSRLGR